ncbi:MAG: hypothetical protein R2719_00565 [Micropruina sp.]
MIIVVCRDDPGLVAIANLSRQGNPGVFGAVHQVFGNQIPQLGVNENLFLISHGVKDGDDGNPTIGGAADDFWVNAVQLFDALVAGNLFPPATRGRSSSTPARRPTMTTTPSVSPRSSAPRSRVGTARFGSTAAAAPPPG